MRVSWQRALGQRHCSTSTHRLRLAWVVLDERASSRMILVDSSRTRLLNLYMLSPSFFPPIFLACVCRESPFCAPCDAISVAMCSSSRSTSCSHRRRSLRPGA